MNLCRMWLLFLGLHAPILLPGQEDPDRICMLWYNVENLFYPANDSLPGDDEFTPEGLRHWTWNRYRTKLVLLAKVIIAAGKGTPPAVVGLCEVEDRRVLEELVAHPILAPYGYRVLHRDGPDHRGMDVACLVRPGLTGAFQWEVISFHPPVKSTRDMMHLTLTRGRDSLDLFLVHLVSRYGGAGATAGIRRAQAVQLVNCIDSVHQARQKGMLLVAGDFNSEFRDYSLEPLRVASFGSDSILPLKPSKGRGTYKYRGRWSHIDQFLLCSSRPGPWMDVSILELAPLMTEDLLYGGMKPKRSYEGYQYLGGLSDHLPLCFLLPPYLFPAER